MEGQFGPNSVVEPNLQYKFQRKLKVFNASSFPNRGYNLVATSNKYGLVFIGSPEGNLLVYYLKDLIDAEYEEPLRLSVLLQETPSHISVSCDDELLAVIGNNFLYIFKVNSFQNHPVNPVVSIACDASSVVSSLQWNPCIPEIIAIAFFNGVLLVANVSTNQMHKIQAKARCVCWSPRGKQIVVGNNDGTLCQYKPDLTPMKMVQAPKLFEGVPIETVAIHWISTYQFAVVYRDASSDSRPVVTIVNTPKGGNPSFLNYDDTCYSLGSSRPWYYYLLGFAPWNIIVASSSNGAEISTLASLDGVNWVQWCQVEEAMPLIPMYPVKVDNFPIGLSLSTCAIHHVLWGEDTELPHMPSLLVLSHTGMLFLFNVINLNNNAPQVCTPPQHLILPASAMIRTAVEPPKPVADPIPPAPVTHPVEVSKQAQPEFSQFSPSLPASTPKPSGFGVAFGAVTAQAPAPSFEPPVQATFTKTSAPPQVQPTSKPPKQVTVTIADALSQPTAVASQDLTANLKEDQRRAQMEANKEFTNMLVKEVNEFQIELYNFMNKAQAIQMQAFYDLSALECNGDLHDMDAKKLKTDCSLEELRESIIQTKLELIRACAVVAEARSQPFAKDLQQWSSPDPLSSKHLSSIKKMVYYIQNQLDQAQGALEYKWNQLAQERQFDDKLGPRMIRPVLDDVYRPLVKQQEILTRQQAVLKTLRTTLMQYDIVPTYNSSSLLRNTPLKEESLSKLTKNILNMKLESAKSKSIPGLSARKVEALRDMLSEHKTVIIKPVDVELREHFSTLRLKHEKALKEKVAKENLRKANVSLPTVPKPETEKIARKATVQNTVQTHPEVKPVKPVTSVPDLKPDSKVSAIFSKSEMKPEFLKPMAPSKPAVTPAVTNVVRTLFTEEAPQKLQPVPVSVPSTKSSVTSNSVLRDILQNKTNTIDFESKSDSNTFMGQKFCSPAATKSSSVNKDIFVSKPFQSTAGSVNIFATNKSAQVLPSSTDNAKSDETGEAELLPKEAQEILSKNAGLTIKTVKSDKPSLFAPKAPVPPLIVPVVVKSVQKPSFSFGKVEGKVSENVFQEKDSVKIVKSTSVFIKQKENEAITIDKTATSEPSLIKSSDFDTSTTSTCPVTTVADISTTITEVKASPAALFSAANAASSGSKSPQSTFATASAPLSPKGSIFGSPTKSTFTGSIFGNKTEVTEKSEASPTAPIVATTASSSVPTTTSSTTASQAPTSSTNTSVAENKSIFGVTETSPKSIFGSAVAASTQSTSVFGSSPTQDSPVFSSAAPTTTTSIFGSPTAVSQASSLSTPINLSTSSSVFASNTGATKPSIFGTPPGNTQTPFVTPDTSTQTPVFGSAPITQTSVFGGATTITSVFGSTSPTTQSSIFGTPAATTQASIFGTPKTTQASIFGTATPTTQASIFGTPSPAANQNSSPFGGAESNLFAAASISTTSAQPTAPGNIFGASNASTGSVFGGGNVFGTKPAFGQSQATNIFGGSSSQFGQQQQQQQNQNSFWNGASNTTGFDSLESEKTAVSNAAFLRGQSQQSSIFGGSGGNFSQPAVQSQGFGSPSGQTSVFGTPQQQQPATAFGGSAAFGSKPVFGQSSGFGGTPTGFGSFNNSPSSGFGGSASFGAPASFGSGNAFGSSSPGKMFGGSSPGFGQSTQSNAMFESLATQNTVSFGNLAQQSPQAPAPAPSFNTSPSFTGWRS